MEQDYGFEFNQFEKVSEKYGVRRAVVIVDIVERSTGEVKWQAENEHEAKRKVKSYVNAIIDAAEKAWMNIFDKVDIASFDELQEYRQEMRSHLRELQKLNIFPTDKETSAYRDVSACIERIEERISLLTRIRNSK